MYKVILTCMLIVGFLSCKAQSVSLSVNHSNNKTLLSWSTNSNEATDRFEIEKSYDGISFKTVALVFTSEKKGSEDYKFYESAALTETAYYRLKIYGSDSKITFSKVVLFPVMIREKKE